MTADETPADPAVILELITAFRRSKTLFAAVELGVFDVLRQGPAEAAAVAASLHTHPDATERLMDACVTLGLLSHGPAGYANTPAADAYLTRTAPGRLTGYIGYSNRVGWATWGKLEDAIRTGTHTWDAAFGPGTTGGGIFDRFYSSPEAKREFLTGMHGFGCVSSPHVVAAFDLSRFRTFADLGGATGHLTVAACRRYPHMRGVVFDLPAAVPLAEETVAAAGLTDRIRVVGGDFFADALPPADLYALGRILHDWTEAKCLTLLRKCHAALPPGGGVLLAEKLLLPDRTGPTWARMQDLNMLVCTEGRERTLAGYADLFAAAGFTDVRCVRTTSPADAVLALRV